MNKPREKITKYFLEDIEVLIDCIIESFDNIFKNNNIKKNNARNIYRWLVYVSYSNIIGKLFCIYNNEKLKIDVNFKKFDYNFSFSTSKDTTKYFYYNNIFNMFLLEEIEKIIENDSDDIKINLNKKYKDIFLYSKYSFNLFNFYYLRFLNKFQLIIRNISPTKSNNIIINEDTGLFRVNKKNIFNIYQKENVILEIDKEQRKKIRNNIIKNFNFDNFKKIFDLSESKVDKIKLLLSKILEFSLPLSLVENLNDKIIFYKNYLKNYNVSEINSLVGHFYDDNFKVFCSAKINPLTKIVVHEHGITNFSKIYTDNEKYFFVKNYTTLKFANFYYAWGKGKLSKRWDGVEDKYKIKIINKCSLNLAKIKKGSKNNKNKINNILYIGGPNKLFLNSIDEVSPLENYNHKLKVVKFIKKILYQNLNLKIVYKNFNSTPKGYEDDIVFNELYNEINSKKINITFSKPTSLYKNFDLILLDMISTPVAEIINTNIPFLVFANKHEYKMASEDGKELNDKFEKLNILSYDIETSNNNFNLLKNRKDEFYIGKNKQVLLKFQELLCYPKK